MGYDGDMSSANFRIVYDGPALAEHTMDVRDLAPALLAVAEMLEEANRVLNGDRAQVRVQVHGSFKTGSFGVDLEVVQTFVSQALDFFANDRRVVGSLNLMELLGVAYGSGMGLVGLVRWLRGRKIRRVEITAGGSAAKVITDDGEQEVEARTIELLRSYKIRQALERAVKVPLDREGVETVAFLQQERVVESIEKHERHAFSAPAPDEKTQIDEQEFTASLQLVSVPLREGYKWRVDDGNGPFTAIVLDEQFMQRMHRSEVPFTVGDILVARVRRRQYMAGSELKNEHEILQIIRHDSAYKQIPLPITRRED